MTLCDCGQPIDRFDKRSSPPKPSKSCVACFEAATRLRHTEDKRRYRKADPDSVRLSYRKWQVQTTYGISFEEYSRMFEEQGRRCKICRATTSGWSKDWHIDHDHETKAIRGILCHKCNLMIGLAKDNPDVLLWAATYLNDQ